MTGESLTWYSSVDTMSTSNRLHGPPNSLTTSCCCSIPLDSVHTFSSLSAAVKQNTSRVTKHRPGDASQAARLHLEVWIQYLEAVTSKILQSIDSYMSMVCKPRISGRCLWSEAGGGSAAGRSDWLLSGCCLGRTGSDLEEENGQVIYFNTVKYMYKCWRRT